MNKIVLVLCLCLAGSIVNAMPDHSWDDGRLLEKNQTSGYVPDHMSFRHHCLVYADKVVVEYQKAWTLTKHIEYKVELPAGIKDLIGSSVDGVISKREAPTDIGNNEYYAYAKLPSAVTQIDLGSVYDSRYISENQAPAAKELKKFIDTTCDTVKNM